MPIDAKVGKCLTLDWILETKLNLRFLKLKQKYYQTFFTTGYLRLTRFNSFISENRLTRLLIGCSGTSVLYFFGKLPFFCQRIQAELKKFGLYWKFFIVRFIVNTITKSQQNHWNFFGFNDKFVQQWFAVGQKHRINKYNISLLITEGN